VDNKPEHIILKGEKIILHPYKCVYWPKTDSLWISDLHLGKTNHFQKAGIPIPDKLSDENWNRLYHVLDIYHPSKVFFMGDLFHSSINIEWDIFGRYLRQFDQIEFHLIMGNHDILHLDAYHLHGISMHPLHFESKPFLFTHHPLTKIPDGWYNICGHVHPAVRLRGSARQGLKLPCFYFGENQGILPAFGAFTGTAAIKPKKQDQVYLIVEDQIVHVS